jgi:hypothetical protein
MKKIAHLVLVFVALLTTQLSAQQTVSRISIQGTLKSSNGASVADGSYTVKFLLYDVPTGGTALWQEEATVEVIGGIYSHYLGSVVQLDGSDFANTLYLGVRIGNFELQPRTELTYAPYTFGANVAQKVICSGAVGDVKYSILDPVKFAQVNGDCWVPMDGRPLASTDALSQLAGLSSLPNAGGLFVRAQDFANSDNDPGRDVNTAVATMQGDEVKSHNHGVSDQGHNHTYASIRWYNNLGDVPPNNDFIDVDDSFASEGWFGVAESRSTDTATTGISINAAGGGETRPKNINLWVYIRIN